nr:MAG TPA: hypothetical protein [Caudoviricetes sp.]
MCNNIYYTLLYFFCIDVVPSTPCMPGTTPSFQKEIRHYELSETCMVVI